MVAPKARNMRDQKRASTFISSTGKVNTWEEDKNDEYI